MPDEIKAGKPTPLKFNPQDAETAKLVREFLNEKAEAAVPEGPGAPGGAPSAPLEDVSPKQVNINPNPEFDHGDPSSQFISDAMAPVDKVVITDMEKQLFLKAVLNDAPVKLPVTLYQGKLTLDIRSRSSFEQKRVFDVLKLDGKQELYDTADLAMTVTRMHYYLGCLMIERINGELFSELTLLPGKTVEEDAKTLREAAAKLFENMTAIRWTSVLNALRIFEHKCARLNSEAANEGFWNPQSSA